MRLGIALVASMAVVVVDAHAETDRPRLEAFTAKAPAWARDCTLDLVEVGEDAFSVAVACRGSEELVFERRSMTTRELESRADADAERLGAMRTKVSISTARGPATGHAMTFEGGAHVIVRRASARGPSDIYVCTSIAEGDQLSRCKALLEAFAHSTVIRRGPAAFARPKS